MHSVRRRGSDIDECFADVSSILAGGFPFCLAELADGCDDIASDSMTSKDGLPKLGRVPDQGINLTAQSTGTWSSDTAVSHAVLKRGVVVMPLSRMNVVSSDTSRLLLGFSGLSEPEADMGTKLLAEVFKHEDFRKTSEP